MIEAQMLTNLEHIYDKTAGYEYFFPKKLLEDYLDGIGFDNQTPYTSEERENLEKDIHAIYQKIMDENPDLEKIAVITAGAPGSGKTELLHRELEKLKDEGKNYAYICPDDVCLKNQTLTYKADLQNSGGFVKDRRYCYNKWRPASNAATHIILANLIRDNRAFCFGTTASSPQTFKLFEFLKNRGYKIRLIHLSTPPEICWRSIEVRDELFVQTTEKDIKEKAALVPQRILDSYLKYADEIDFYYREHVHANALFAAKWIRSKNEHESPDLKIIDHEYYKKIKEIHNACLNSESPLRWELTVESNK